MCSGRWHQQNTCIYGHTHIHYYTCFTSQIESIWDLFLKLSGQQRMSVFFGRQWLARLHISPKSEANYCLTMRGKYVQVHYALMVTSRAMGHQMTGNLVVCSTALSDDKKGTIKVQHDWPFVRGIHRCLRGIHKSLLDSPHKESIIQKACRLNEKWHGGCWACICYQIIFSYVV